MEPNKKKKTIYMITISSIIIFIIFITYFILFKNDKTKITTSDNANIQYNKNEPFLKEQENHGLTFTKIECYFDGENSTINYVITNETNETIHLGMHEIIIKNEKGQILTTINPDYDYDLEPKKEFIASSVVNLDLTSAYTMELNLDEMFQKTEE